MPTSSFGSVAVAALATVDQMCFGTMGMAPAPPNCRNVATGFDRRNSTVRGPAALTSAMSGTGWAMIVAGSFWSRW